MEPTKIYVQELTKLIDLKLINSCAHITGGGIKDNLSRIIPKGKCAKINLNKINLIDSYKKYKKVAYGALVKTKSSYYLISVGLGKFIIEGKNIFIISLSSPVGKSLFDKKKEEPIIINDIEDEIIEIF